MEFLKAILGEELYTQIESKINEHNGNESNKDKQIKLGNLGSGEYVSKGKYDGISADLTSKNSELEKANSLIEEMKKASKGNEDMQGKITDYETQVANLQKEVAEMKVKTAVEIALHKENAADVDYLTYKLNEKLSSEGKSLELDDNDNIKGWNDLLSGLKTQFPTQFENSKTNVIKPNPLPSRENKGGEITKEQFDKMGYNSRQKLKAENPELYNQMKEG